MNFSRRALKQEYQKNLESFLRMSLKAQNQCRMTLETLATIKNPPVVFARQVNVAQQQQVNNGAGPYATSTRTHAANCATAQTQLLEASDGQRLDTGAAGTVATSTGDARRADRSAAIVGPRVHLLSSRLYRDREPRWKNSIRCSTSSKT